MIRLDEYIHQDRVVDLQSRTKEAALRELVEACGSSAEIADTEALLLAILDRERIVSTGIGLGVAVPHAKIPSVSEFVVGYGRSADGIEFGSIDDRPVHHIVLIAGPPDRQQRYLQFLATVTLRLKSPAIREALEDAATPADLFRVLAGS